MKKRILLVIIGVDRGISPSEVDCKNITWSIGSPLEVEDNDVVLLIFEVDDVNLLIIPPSEVAVLVSGVCRGSNSISSIRSCFSNLEILWRFFL